MLLSNVIREKYVFMKCENGKLEFWNEDAYGYVDNLYDAGIFYKEDIKRFGLRYYNNEEIKKKLYKKNIHFAISLKNAIKHFMY